MISYNTLTMRNSSLLNDAVQNTSMPNKNIQPHHDYINNDIQQRKIGILPQPSKRIKQRTRP